MDNIGWIQMEQFGKTVDCGFESNFLSLQHDKQLSEKKRDNLKLSFCYDYNEYFKVRQSLSQDKINQYKISRDCVTS
jgi:hypothetical protein